MRGVFLRDKNNELLLDEKSHFELQKTFSDSNALGSTQDDNVGPETLNHV